MQVELLCGQNPISVELPESTMILNPKPVDPLPNPEQAVAEALADPIDAAPLATIASGRKNACIVISDITRPVPNQLILPPMLKILEEAGIARKDITILIATGMHRPNLGDELKSMVGAEIMENYRIVNHYCRKDEDLRWIAEIDGAPIELNIHYLDADLKILTGLIEPHMYAGYSGGRKAILPGISSFKTMKFMHSFKMIDHPGVTNCLLDGNPFHEAGERVMEMTGADFMVNVVINKVRQMVGVFAGHPTIAHQAGCKMVEQTSVRHLDDEADLVVTSAGGYPLDSTFYQVSKGLIAARNVLRKGGAVVVTCGCREGLGSSEYCELVREGHTPESFFSHRGKPEHFVIDQWCLQTTYQALDHANQVYVYSPHLEASDLAKLGIRKIEDVQAEINRLLPDHPRVIASPEGPYVVGLVRGRLNQAA